MLERQSADGFRGHTHGDATNPTTYANIDHILNTHLATNGYLGAGAHHGYCQELLLGEGETGAIAWQVAGLLAIQLRHRIQTSMLLDEHRVTTRPPQPLQ